MSEKSDSILTLMQIPEYNMVFRDPETVLKKQLGDDISVVDFESESFLKFGDNYGSTLMKIAVSVARKNSNKIEKLQLIGKLLPPTSMQRQMMESDYTFQKEMFFYKQLIPIYQDIYNEEFRFAPEYYGSRKTLEYGSDKISEDAVILLENLKVKDYYLVDRHKGLDLEHLNILIPVIAKFHAIGLSLKHKRPSILPALKKYNRRLAASDPSKIYMEKIMHDMAKYPEMKQYCVRIQALYENPKNLGNFYTETLEMTDPWACVAHLDLWNNNILFHRDEDGTLDDVKIVDFQTYAVSSPLRDLIFLLCTSMQYPLEHFDSMMEVYRQSVCEILENEINVDPCIFEKQQFGERLKIDAITEIFHLIIAIFAVEYREGDDIEVEPTNEFVIRRLSRVCEIFEQKKWF